MHCQTAVQLYPRKIASIKCISHTGHILVNSSFWENFQTGNVEAENAVPAEHNF